MKSLKKWWQASRRRRSAHEDDKATAQRTARQSVKQNLDCSQIENEEEEEEEDRRKENQMAVQWAEDEKREEIFERRRMEGSSFAGWKSYIRYQGWWYMSECPKAKKGSAQKK